MVAISFSKKPEFPQMIIDGVKDQTIRPFNAKRYDQIKRIKKLQLYWKQRTKECFKIADAELIEIFKMKFIFHGSGYHIHPFNEVGGYYTVPPYSQVEEIIKRDGLTEEEFYPLFQETYGDIGDMEFMVIRFKVTGIPDYSYEYAKKLAKRASEDDGLISDEMMDTLDEMEKDNNEKIGFFWHKGKKVPIKPIEVPVKLSIEGDLRLYTAWYEPLHVYGVGMTPKEAIEDIRSDISTLYQHYYLGDRDNMVGNSHDIIAWFDEHLRDKEVSEMNDYGDMEKLREIQDEMEDILGEFQMMNKDETLKEILELIDEAHGKFVMYVKRREDGTV